MSELKQLIEKFIELDDNLNEKAEGLEESEEAFEKFEADHIDEINELNETYHEIEHMVFHEEFIIVFNKTNKTFAFNIFPCFKSYFFIFKGFTHKISHFSFF